MVRDSEPSAELKEILYAGAEISAAGNSHGGVAFSDRNSLTRL